MSESETSPLSNADQLEVCLKAPTAQAAFTTATAAPSPPAFPEAAAPPAAAAVLAEEKKIAVLICHGMGQQVPFETLDCVAKALGNVEQRNHQQRPPASVQFVKLGEDMLPRAELTLTAPDGGSRGVHLYEAYWAPMTEGKVTTFDVIRFLLSAGWNGIKYSIGGSFDRWMFGGPQQLALHWTTLLQLLAAFAVIASLIVISFTFIVVAFLNILVGFNILWPENILTDALTRDLLHSPLILSLLAALYIFALAIYKTFKWVSERITPKNEDTQTPSPSRQPAKKLSPALRWIIGLGLALILIDTVLTGTSILYHLVSYWADTSLPPPSAPLDARPPAHPWRSAFYLLFWVSAAIVLYRARWYFVQYAGDVTAYVSAHTVNKFYEVRERIRQVGMQVAHAAYVARKPGSNEFEYDQLIIVGHSLGSVLAYDTLNAMINKDILSDGTLNVVQRTKLLLTFGSPLDKTAFIFRTQTKQAVVREALAAAKQPLIQSYDYRPARWINIWSRHDWISGAINYYDLPHDGSMARDARCVKNIDRK